MSEYKSKSFWKRPEGKIGGVLLVALLAGAGLLITNFMSTLVALAANTLWLAGMFLILGLILYMILDPRMRNLIWYLYKSVIRWITGLFVEIDPIGVLKNYIKNLRENIKKMDRQITQLRGQMHILKEQILNNQRAIQDNLSLASQAKESNKRDVMILKSRKAGRLKESNLKLEDLYRKMEVMYRVLGKMFENSTILVEDVEDQVKVKERERKAIRASHGAMKSAMNIISGSADQRYIFDQALEAIAEDVSKKVGEMERFMEVSENFMSSVDLQNGVFEEKGLNMLEQWEKEGKNLLLGGEKENLLLRAESQLDVLDLDAPIEKPIRAEGHKNQYDTLFD